MLVGDEWGTLPDHHSQGVVGMLFHCIALVVGVFRIQVVVGAYRNPVEVGVDHGRTLEVEEVVVSSHHQLLRQPENPSRSEKSSSEGGGS